VMKWWNGRWVERRVSVALEERRKEKKMVGGEKGKLWIIAEEKVGILRVRVIVDLSMMRIQGRSSKRPEMAV